MDGLCAAFDMPAAFRHFVEMLLLILQPFIWLGLCIGFVLASAHLLTMLGTRWGDRRVSSKSLLFSVGIHLSIGVAVIATIPEYRNHVLSLATGMPVEVQIEMESKGGGPVPQGVRGGNVPAWEKLPSAISVERERLPTAETPPAAAPIPIARPEIADVPEFRPVESAPPLEPQRTEPAPARADLPVMIARTQDVAPSMLSPPQPVTAAEGVGAESGQSQAVFSRPVRERSGAGVGLSAAPSIGQPFRPAGSPESAATSSFNPEAPRAAEESFSTLAPPVMEAPMLARAGDRSPTGDGLPPGRTAPAAPQEPEIPSLGSTPGAPSGPAMTAGRPGGRDPRTLLRGNAESPYAIEIWVMKDGRYEPRPFSYDGGRAFVSLGHDDLYAINIINESQYDSGVSIFIDGTNMFAYSEVKGYNGLVLTKEMRAALIRGWHINNETSDSFQISDYENRVPQSSTSKEFGTITVTFSAAWSPDEAPPPDEQAFQKGVRGGGLTTGRGPSVSQRYREINRHIGAVRSTLTVYYRKQPR